MNCRCRCYMGDDNNHMFGDIGDVDHLGYQVPSHPCIFHSIHIHRGHVHDFLAQQNPSRWMGAICNLSFLLDNHDVMDQREEQEDLI